MIQDNKPSLELDQATTDLTSAAQEGKLDLVIAHNDEIEKLIEILCYRENNNTVLTGNRGVGKTSIVEGLAQHISNGNVPDILRHRRIKQLDLGRLIYKSQHPSFDEFLARLIQHWSLSSDIIFISEPEFFVRRLPQNLTDPLKSAIGQNRFLCIAEMSTSEFEKCRETDPELSEHFQPLHVSEPRI